MRFRVNSVYIFGRKLCCNLITDFETARPDRWSDGCHEIAWCDIVLRSHVLDRRFDNTGDCSSPSGVDCSDGTSVSRSYEDRLAISHTDQYGNVDATRYKRVATHRSITPMPMCIDDVSAVYLALETDQPGIETKRLSESPSVLKHIVRIVANVQ
jgi:hypothetical protein